MTKSVEQTILKLQKAEELYAIMSLCTRMPYVECDGETYDDQILVFFEEVNAKREVQKLIEKKIPVQLVRLTKNAVLPFFVNLFPLGVNCVVVNRGADGAVVIQLQEMLRRPDRNRLPDGKLIIENPALHLTAIYYMQELKRVPPEQQDKVAMEELYEEMLSHFQKGKYIIAAREEDSGIPLLKQPNGDLFHPIFTDIQEFQKFCVLNKNEKFKTGIIEAKNIIHILAPNAKGIAINPMGVNVMLQMVKK